MGMVTVRPDIIEAVLGFAITYGQAKPCSAADVGCATLAAGLAILSNGMNDEQVRALLEQAFEYTAPIRSETEARWKRTGFDPFGEPES